MPAHHDGARPNSASSEFPPKTRWSSAMPDTKAHKLRDAPEPIGAPRLLNAAAWLETLAALESEFKTALSQTAASEQMPERHRGS
jgi:hypothetical protein